MPYQVLARKYRPLRFSDVVGQDHVTRTLLNALEKQRIAHGYIFSGHRGIGKTTIARILASALNCRNAIGSPARPTPEPCNACDSCLEIRQGNAVDVIEIDAATNRGIDEIRELRDAARYRPSRDKYKIYILDEAHQITDAAFNALLKTLEEPPEHIVFMMATTQPEDIPQTIRSRCQHFSFHAVKLDDIVGQLQLISRDENIGVDDAALALLAEAGDGSMRDALSIMDQAIASAPTEDGKPLLTVNQIRELMGTVSNVVYEQILEAVDANSSADVLSTMSRLLDAGNGPQQLARQFVRYLRNCTIAKITALQPDVPATGIAADLLQISDEERRRAARSAALFTEEELSRFLSIMLRTFDELGYRQEQRLHLELGLLKLVHVQRLVPIEELLSQLGAPPQKGAASSMGAPVRTTRSAQPGATVTTASSTLVSGTSTLTSPRPTPFEVDRSRKTPIAHVETTSTQHITAGALALAQPPMQAVGPKPVQVEAERPCLVEPVVATSVAEPIGVPQEPPATALASSIDTAALQSSCVAALNALKGQGTAAHTIEEATFVLSGNSLDVQTTVSQAMLPVAINPEADRAIKAALRENGAGELKLRFLPGTAKSTIKAKAPRVAAAGSVEELAAKHPLVQQAQQLFGAEISNVIDLREKN